jgi:pyruvate dehydrogenase E2 component (dihydrolipoamide acetyltransferase)
VIETDKTLAEVESPRTGTLEEILVAAGTTVAVGTVIARISLTESDSQEPPPEQPEESVHPSHPQSMETQVVEASRSSAERKEASTQPAAPRILATPRAKKLADELRFDIAAVSAYAGKQNLVEKDVRGFAEHIRRDGLATASATVPVVKEPPSSARRIIAQSMAASFRDVPHFYLDRSVDVRELVKMRQNTFPQIEKQTGVHLTYTDILLKAIAVALEAHPELNRSWHEDGIVRHSSINVGIAVQAPGRLLVPVLRNVDKLSLVDLGKERSSLVSMAQAGRLSPEYMAGASCSLSNLGAYGVDHFHAIINPPESAILAAGRIADRAVVPVLSLSLSVDHRLVDGTLAAAFLNSIVQAIESPYGLLFH